MIKGITVKGKPVKIPSQLQMQILRQLHNNQMGIEKKRLLVCESVYWVNMNADKENAAKQCSTCLDDQNVQPKIKTTSLQGASKAVGGGWYTYCIINNENFTTVSFWSLKR